MINLTDYRAEQIADEAARRLEQQLKPCPFCGSEAKMLHNMSKTDYWVECVNCKTCAPGDLNDHTEEEAIEAWNIRAERTCQAEYRTGGNEFGAFYCSACNNYMDENDRYCPSCGAKVATKDFSLCNDAKVVEE